MNSDLNNSFPSRVSELVEAATKKFNGNTTEAMNFLAKKLGLTTAREIYRWQDGRIPKHSDEIIEKMESALSVISPPVGDLRELVAELADRVAALERQIRESGAVPAAPQEKKVWILRQATLKEFE